MAPAQLRALCALLAAVVVLAVQASAQEYDQVADTFNTDIYLQSSLASQSTQGRRLLTRLLLQQQQQQGGQQGQGQNTQQQQQLDKLLANVDQMSSNGGRSSSEDIRALSELARGASGPDEVVIVDNSAAAQNLVRRSNDDEQIIVVPVSQPQSRPGGSYTAACFMGFVTGWQQNGVCARLAAASDGRIGCARLSVAQRPL
jgi:hypothetical protein